MLYAKESSASPRGFGLLVCGLGLGLGARYRWWVYFDAVMMMMGKGCCGLAGAVCRATAESNGVDMAGDGDGYKGMGHAASWVFLTIHLRAFEHLRSSIGDT